MNWKNMPLAHKIATIISGIAVVVWLISHLQADLLPENLSTPAIAVFTVCEAVIYWKSKRTLSYLFIAGAIISMACFIGEMFL